MSSGSVRPEDPVRISISVLCNRRRIKIERCHTDEQVKSRWVHRLKGAVELQRSAAFLAIHVGHG